MKKKKRKGYRWAKSGKILNLGIGYIVVTLPFMFKDLLNLKVKEKKRQPMRGQTEGGVG